MAKETFIKVRMVLDVTYKDDKVTINELGSKIGVAVGKKFSPKNGVIRLDELRIITWDDPNSLPPGL